MRVPLVVMLLIAVTLLSACVAPSLKAPACDAERLVVQGTRFLDDMARPDGGVVPYKGGPTEPRLTAWALVAAALARRAGFEGLFDPVPHTAYLESSLPRMFQEGTGVDSSANNVSLARAALQTWGRHATSPHILFVEDAQHANVTTLAEAWEARYDAATGRYAERLNEHLFAGFAARLFESDAARLAAMADALADTTAWTHGATHDPFDGDVWFAAYARALLGPEPRDATVAAHLDALIAARQDETGGVSSIAAATGPDASSTAAALLAWGESGATLDDPRVVAAIDHLCENVRRDGGIPFRSGMQTLMVKTTAENVIALSLILEPIAWPEGRPADG